jgi:methionyl-tRNA formyltransferase
MKIIFFGSSVFAVPALEKLKEKKEEVVLVVTRPDRKKGRSLKIGSTPVKEKAEELGIEIFQPGQINSEESAAFLKKFNADLFVTASFGQIMSKTILALPKQYCLNIHASLLPEYRGASPINRVIADGKKETGVTIMRMNEKMDEGDIILKGIVPVDEQDDAVTLLKKLSRKGADILSEVIRVIKDGRVEFIPQDHDKATYAPKLKKEDGLICWNDSAYEIYNKIRAYVPWPCCYTHWNAKILKIWKAKPVSAPIDETIKPGTVLEADKTGIPVKTGQGALKIEELQLEGSRRMTAEQFLAGHKLIKQL